MQKNTFVTPTSRGWLPTAAVSQELDCIFHHHCLISWLCAWRPILHLTFLKVRQAHVEQTRGNEVRRKVLILAGGVFVHVWVVLFLFSFKNAQLRHWESFHLCDAELVSFIPSSMKPRCRDVNTSWENITVHLQRISIFFFCRPSFNFEEQLEVWYWGMKHAPGETLGNDDTLTRRNDASRS